MGGEKTGLKSWWVQVGSPQILLTTNNQDIAGFPQNTKKISIPDGLNVDLFFSDVKYSGHTIPTWIIAEKQNTDEKLVRLLKTYLFRLHAEHESLRLVLRQILSGEIPLKRDSNEFQTLQKYLNTATRRITRLEKKSKQAFYSQVIEFAKLSLQGIKPGETELFLDTLAQLDIRPNIRQKVSEYIDQWDDVKNITVIEKMEIEQMGDKYKVKQAGVVGPNSRVRDTNFDLSYTESVSKIDLDMLASELALLRQQLKGKATKPQHDSSIGEIANAEIAAKEGNSEKSLEHLSKTGKWVFEVATKIGVSVAAAALKIALGL